MIDYYVSGEMNAFQLPVKTYINIKNIILNKKAKLKLNIYSVIHLHKV